MKIKLILLIFLLPYLSYSQIEETEKIISGKAIVFDAVGTNPVFPGGEDSLRQFIKNNINYSSVHDRKNGTVYIGFVVNVDGSLSNLKILKGLTPDIDKESIRLVSSMPNWIPGTQNGKKINIEYTIPIKYDFTDKPQLLNDEIISDKEIIILDWAEELPEFPGGESEMIRFLANRYEYPKEAVRNGEEGTVYVSFLVMKDGHIDSVKVIKGVSPSLNKEALRVISLMPNWKPGMQKGKAVNVRYTLPIRASLGGGRKVKIVYPEFPGGEKVMNNYLVENFIFPKKKKDQNVEGKTKVYITISEEGKVIKTIIGNELSKNIDKELKRVINSMPKMKPGTKDGINSNIVISLTVSISNGKITIE